MAAWKNKSVNIPLPYKMESLIKPFFYTDGITYQVNLFLEPPMVYYLTNGLVFLALLSTFQIYSVDISL